MKRIAAILAGMFAVIMLTITPASAVTDQGSCAYDPGVNNHVSTSLTVTLGGDGRFYVTGKLWNDGAARTWDWEMFHNGSLSAANQKVGGFTADRTMINFNGADAIEFRVRNAARTIDCWAKVLY